MAVKITNNYEFEPRENYIGNVGAVRRCYYFNRNNIGITMGKKFINKFCDWCGIEAPKNERTSDLVSGLAMCWAIALLGWFTMWLVYGG